MRVIDAGKIGERNRENEIRLIRSEAVEEEDSGAKSRLQNEK